MSRLKKDLDAINETGSSFFGYLDIDMFNCPPFIMFTNDEDCPVCSNYIHLKNFERESMTLWCNLVPFATSIIDIGAQCGVYSLAAAAIRGDISIHTFEPNPEGFSRVLVNMAANDFKNIKPHREAVGHIEASIAFSWVPKWLGHISSGGSIGYNTYPEATRVLARLSPLDKSLEGVNLGPKPLIKIDVEGAEARVFAGMAGVLARKPDIFLETFSDEACEAINALTRPLGYNYFFIDEDNRRIEQRDGLAPSGKNSEQKNQLLSVRPPQSLYALA